MPTGARTRSLMLPCVRARARAVAALGMIVVVEHSPLDEMYDGLPVVAVDSLARSVTAANLSAWARAHVARRAAGAYNLTRVGLPGGGAVWMYERLLGAFWAHTFNEAARLGSGRGPCRRLAAGRGEALTFEQS
eukprot:6540367-Prymnesium_polylepis.1